MFYRPSFPYYQTNGQPRGSWGKRQEVSKFSVRWPLYYAPHPSTSTHTDVPCE